MRQRQWTERPDGPARNLVQPIGLFGVLSCLLPTTAVSQVSEWQLRHPRNSHGTAIVDELIAIGGGQCVGGHCPQIGYLNLVEVRTLSGEMRDLWRLSVPRYDVAGVGHDGKFYFAGGRIPPLGHRTDRLDVFDRFGFRRVSSIPIPAGRAAAAAVGDIVVIAGASDDPSTPQIDDQIQILDTVTDQWSLRPIPYGLASAAADERWLVVGGRLSNAPSGTVEIYDSHSRSWTTIADADVPVFPEVAVMDGVAYFVSSFLQENRIRTLDLSTGAWDTIVPPWSQYAPEVAAVGGYLLRGFGFGPSQSADDYRMVDIYDLRTARWRRWILDEGAFLRTVSVDRERNAIVFTGGADPATGLPISNVDVVRIAENLEQVVCGNPIQNSTGSVAVLSAAGFAEVELDLLTLRAEGLPPLAAGVVLVSASATNPTPVQGAAGNLCLGAPLGVLRMSGNRSDASGRMAVGPNLSALPFASPIAVRPGDTWFFQAWHRDRPSGGLGSVLTDAVAVQFR